MPVSSYVQVTNGSSVTGIFVVNSSYIVPATEILRLGTSACTSLAGVYLPTNSTCTNLTNTWPTISQTSTFNTAGNNFLYFNGLCIETTAEQARAHAAYQLRSQKRFLRADLEKTRRAKSSIKKALKLMFNVGFEEEARIFLKGDTVEVCHPDSILKFVISKNQCIMDRTKRPGFSTPYSLSLYTKSDVFVSKLCVYMKDTPVLDQVLALAMFIKSGDEEVILRQANWYNKSEDEELKEILALEYPFLAPKLLPSFTLRP